MKKYALSLLVIFTFLIYAYHEQQEGATAANAVIAPSSLATSNIKSSNTTPSPIDTTNPLSSGTPIPSDTPIPTDISTPVPTPTTQPASSGYKDGTYTGNEADAFYGYIQVRATISGGKISDVQFLDYPRDRGTSIMINSQAMPYLRQEAIQAQSANVNIISGATDSSRAFVESLSTALQQAKG